MSSRRPQPRQHPEACARTFGAFYTDMRRMNETAADVGGTTPASLAREILPYLTRAASLPKR